MGPAAKPKGAPPPKGPAAKPKGAPPKGRTPKGAAKRARRTQKGLSVAGGGKNHAVPELRL